MRYSRVFLSVCLICTFALTWSLAAATDAPASKANDSEPAEARLPDELIPDELTLPDPELMAPCSATLDCEDGNVVSCTGNNSCTASQSGGYVECDGQRTTCPNYCQVAMFCDCECRSVTVFCSSLSGNCQQSGGSISCDGGITITCDRICSRPCFPKIP